jgi:hypothetical protein
MLFITVYFTPTIVRMTGFSARRARPFAVPSR